MSRLYKISCAGAFLLFGIIFPQFSFAASPVALGTAENFAILAKTGVTVSATSTTAIAGDLGISPAAASALSGFSEAMDSGNQFSTSAFVGGKIYAADYTSPALLTQAISDMDTALNDAGTRPFPTATGRAGGEIGGLAFTPGIYKWNTGVVINSDVTLVGGIEDVWIFQIGEGLDVAPGVKIILQDGASAKNIFWKVSGQTTLGAGAVFEGNILGQTAVVLKSGATLNGRALSQTAVILNDKSVITKPGLLPFVAVPAPSPVPPAVVPDTTIPNPSPVPPPVTPPTISHEADLQNQINTLMATLQALIAQAKNAGISLPANVAPFTKPTTRFTQNLTLGSRGNEVSALQDFLISKKVGPESEKLSAVGATGYFGTLTQKALMEFQNNAGITPASGYFGPKTMSYINTII